VKQIPLLCVVFRNSALLLLSCYIHPVEESTNLSVSDVRVQIVKLRSASYAADF